jgi:glycosyltransferase involved in cell wall biosynthesis
MRVLLVSHHAPPHIGGVENLVLAEAEAFVEAGHEVAWITSDGGGAGRVLGDRQGLRIVRVPACHWPERATGIAYPLFSPSLLFHLWREIGRADLVHVHGLVFPGSPFGALFARLRRVTCLCTDHGGVLRYESRLATWSLRLLIETVGRFTARCSHKLIAYNQDLERLLARLSGSAAKVQFLANPVDRGMFQPPDAAARAAARRELGWDDRPRVLCVSRLLAHKGLDILLAARDPSFEVVFCGPGEPVVRDRLRAGGAECLEARPPAGILSLYHAADAFALPSHNEGFPVVVQEALACGLPVVTSDLPAYAPYRGTPGLHLCEPTPAVVRQRLLDVLQQPRRLATGQSTGDGAVERRTWLSQLCRGLPDRRKV